MKEQIYKIKALWVDDEPSESFMDLAYEEGIEIEPCETVSKGLAAIDNKTKLFDCLIIDANCKDKELSEAPSLHALRKMVDGITERKIDIPWFVYTGGSYEGKEALEYMVPKEKLALYGTKIWYNKPDDKHELFSAIKKAVENNEQTLIKKKYADAFAICNTHEMMDLLKRMDSDEFDSDSTVPNTLRCIAEALCDYLHDHDIYPIDFNSSNKIKECSLLFGKDISNKVVPTYIQNLFLFLTYYCNGGSHGRLGGKEEERDRSVRQAILSRKAGFLNKTAMFAMLTIIKWSRSIPVNNEQEMKRLSIYLYDLSQKNKSNDKNSRRL